MTKPNGQNIGYVRVSTLIQNTARQLDGIDLDEVFEEKASGKDVNRPVLQECIKYARTGDVVHVHSIDRLARNLSDLEKIVKEFNENGVAVNFHKENLVFTGEDDPTQTLLFQLIGSVAQFERSLIKERQREGIALAKAKGKHCGRKPSLSKDQIREIQRRVDAGEAKKALAIEYGISRQTLYNALAN